MSDETAPLLKYSMIAFGALVAALALSVVVLIACLTIADPFGGAPHPTDAAMLAQFAKNRPALEEIVGMIGDSRA